jgi:hypothetical protein
MSKICEQPLADMLNVFMPTHIILLVSVSFLPNSHVIYEPFCETLTVMCENWPRFSGSCPPPVVGLVMSSCFYDALVCSFLAHMLMAEK